jgi:hypothetical protein
MSTGQVSTGISGRPKTKTETSKSGLISVGAGMTATILRISFEFSTMPYYFDTLAFE